MSWALLFLRSNMIKIMTKKSWNSSQEAVKHVINENIDLRKRVREVENKYEQDSGISIRNEVTRVYAKFDKIEMCIIQAGIMKLIEKPGANQDDLQFYLSLAKKVEGFIDNMQDPKEEDVK